jgi:hypothetical protein
MTPFLSLGPVQIITIASIVLMTLLFTLIALIDILRSRFKETNDKLIWVLIVLFLGIFGALLYLIIGRSQRVKQT